MICLLHFGKAVNRNHSSCCVQIIVPLLRVLVLMHEQHILHRDIKPENIFLTGKQKLKLGDLGLAIRSTEELPFTRSGTLDYMAPEVCKTAKPKQLCARQKLLHTRLFLLPECACAIPTAAVGRSKLHIDIPVTCTCTLSCCQTLFPVFSSCIAVSDYKQVVTVHLHVRVLHRCISDINHR